MLSKYWDISTRSVYLMEVQAKRLGPFGKFLSSNNQCEGALNIYHVMKIVVAP